MLISVIVPTYNEKDNIPVLIPAVFSVLRQNGWSAEVVVGDDNSPDGTCAVVEALMSEYPDLRLYVHTPPRGLSRTAIECFRIAQGDIIVVMDADLSHPPEKLPELIGPILNNDSQVVVASRFLKADKTPARNVYRRFMTRLAMQLARLATVEVTDPLSGFFAFRREVVEGVKLKPLGYKIGLEIILRGCYRRITEIPITLEARRFGQTKFNWRTVWEYLLQLTLLFPAPHSRWRVFCDRAVRHRSHQRI